MTTTSYPAVGQNGLTETQWANLFGDQDGIVEDYLLGGVSACALARSGDVATVGVGKIKVNNYLLEITSATDLAVPAVSASTVYFICAVYDPALNVADSSDVASPDGPCRLVVTTGAPDTTGGKVYVTLYTITRAASQSLTAATVLDARQWRGPTVLVPAIPAGSPAGFGPFPRGSHLWVIPGDGGKFEHLVLDLVGTALAWRSLSKEPARAFPMPSGLVSRDGAPSSPQFFVYAGCMVKCRGTIKKSSGSLTTGSSDVTLGTFPTGFRPAFTERFNCKTGSGRNYAEVRVDSTGVVTLTGTSGDTHDWVDISAITFRIEN